MFEKMFAKWMAPATVAFYGTDEELERLNIKISRSGVLRKRGNIVYHVIYKRHVSVNT